MFPIKDDNPKERRPLVVMALIAANISIFAYAVFLALNGELEGFIDAYALVPKDIVAGSHLSTLFTSMFLHGGFLHVTGNMLYLHIFGDNVEDIMGRKRFIAFYLLSGLAASALQIYTDPNSTVPNLGASGAIAGVLGAYLVSFPRARVHTIVFIGYFVRWIRLPAFLVLGSWFVIQLFSGVGSLGIEAADAGGIAYFAHIGGFLAGIVLVWFFRKR